jgi:D-3-phosphoglycerate dehydrogenase
MARWKILVSAPYMQPVVERFRPRLEEEGCELIIPPVEERLEEEDLLGLVGDIDGALCGDDRFTERVMRAAPRLKVISKWGTGIDSIDRKAAARLDIAVCNTPNAFSEPVADSVYAYMLCFARRTPWLDRAMKAGEWLKLPGRALRECTLGVIGVGNVGKAVLRRAGGFGMRVLGNDIVEIDPAFVDEVGLEVVDKPALFREADFVSINCDLNPTSHHLMNDVAFDMMKSTGVLINTARGPIVDQPALIRALRESKIAGAGLDVFEEEPLSDDSPLLGFDNVLLAPHNANSSPEAWEHVHENTIRNLLEELKRRS